MPIELLPDQLASQIAAGEVVERPASVVKELVENAIDAGATTINVDVRGGGRELIQIADDGEGIPADELETAFMRHATSKLRNAQELEAIGTLGFRGEALASIAAVSRITAVSRTTADTAGSRLTLDGGKPTGREKVGAPKGTVIAVSNLFYNVPARLKFLKSQTTERRVIDELVTRYALAYPNIRFRLTHENRITFQSNGNGSLPDVLTAVYGPDTAKQLLKVGVEDDQGSPANGKPLVSVSGYVGPPSLNRSNRAQITLFINGRWVKDSSLTYAVIQAYHTLLPTGRFPLALVFLSIPAENVDVNVHPAKTEVRLRPNNLAFGPLQRAVRNTLVDGSPIPHASHFTPVQSPGWGGSIDDRSFARREDRESQTSLDLDWPSPTVEGQLGTAIEVDLEKRNLAGDQLPIMRVVGQAGASYIITEGPDGLFLIDQHAAHERILYEQFMNAWTEGGGEGTLASQRLLDGSPVYLSPAQSALLDDNLDLLARIGFEIEPFGPNAYKVRSVPSVLTRKDPAQALLDVVEDLERGEAPLQSTMESRIILRVCKSAAVKAGQTLSNQEMEAMVRQLEKCHNPHTCPHGRPTLIHLSVAQLAKEFGRI